MNAVMSFKKLRSAGALIHFKIMGRDSLFSLIFGPAGVREKDDDICCAVGSSFGTDFPRGIDSGSSICVTGWVSPCERVEMRLESMIECRRKVCFVILGLFEGCTIEY